MPKTSSGLMSLLGGSSKASNLSAVPVEQSVIFAKDKKVISTNLPILNVAFSGELDGGFEYGFTMFCGKTGCYKSMLALFCVSAFLNKYENGVVLFYDSEYGIKDTYFEQYNIDISRVLHIGVSTIEDLSMDLQDRLSKVTREDKLMVVVDSLGNLSSKLELKNVEEGEMKPDIQRTKVLKSFSRIITNYLNPLDIPGICINHVYDTMDKYNPLQVSGGSGAQYIANTIFIISKTQEKDGKYLVGYNFNIDVYKSRYIKTRSKLSFNVDFSEGINLYSGILDLAVEFGFVKLKGGWYELWDVDTDTGTGIKSHGAEGTNKPEFLGVVMENSMFKELVRQKYQYNLGN